MSAADYHEEEAPGRVYDRRLAARLLVRVRPYWRLVAVAVALLLVEGLLQLAGPLLTRRVIDEAIPAGDEGMIVESALLFGGALLAQFAAGYGQTILTALVGQRVMRDLRNELFAHLQRLPVRFLDRNPVGRLVTRVTSDVESLNELFTAGVVAGLGDLFALGAIGALMLAADWRLALTAFAVIPFVVLASRVFQRHVRSSYRDIRARLARINAFLQERITGMQVVQLFGREGDERRRFAELNDSHLRAHLRSVRVYALYLPVIEVLTSVALASLLVGATGRVGGGTLTVGTVAAFLQLVRRFFQPLQDLSDKYNTLQQAMAASERIFGLLDTQAEPAPAAGRHLPVRATRGATVEFEDVWFRYAAVPVAYGAVPVSYAAVPVTDGAVPVAHGAVPVTDGNGEHPAADGADPVRSVEGAAGGGAAATGAAGGEGDGAPSAKAGWVLRGVSFVVRPGETLALVGHTGAGKTTILSLLLRFYEPQRGRILVDGVDVRELSRDELRSRLAYVQQDIFLFAADVRSNIRLAAPLSDAEVALAASRVGADRVIDRLPRRYDQVLGERGSSLSVGERQLLSFARAIASDPDLLLLDEATSAVDSETEAAIQEGLAALMRGRTTIAVAHRLSTIVGATEILVLHHGQVRERGTHRELLARGGLYERLYRLQIGTAAGALPAAG